jgi:hypothetical protein
MPTLREPSTAKKKQMHHLQHLNTMLRPMLPVRPQAMPHKMPPVGHTPQARSSPSSSNNSKTSLDVVACVTKTS